MIVYFVTFDIDLVTPPLENGDVHVIHTDTFIFGLIWATFWTDAAIIYDL